MKKYLYRLTILNSKGYPIDVQYKIAENFTEEMLQEFCKKNHCEISNVDISEIEEYNY